MTDLTAAAQRPAAATTALRGNKVPRPHRLHLSGGRVIQGEIHRAPNVRLADHLAALKGFISLTEARCETTGTVFAHILVNVENVLFIEEVPMSTRAA